MLKKLQNLDEELDAIDIPDEDEELDDLILESAKDRVKHETGAKKNKAKNLKKTQKQSSKIGKNKKNKPPKALKQHHKQPQKTVKPKTKHSPKRLKKKMNKPQKSLKRTKEKAAVKIRHHPELHTAIPLRSPTMGKNKEKELRQTRRKPAVFKNKQKQQKKAQNVQKTSVPVKNKKKPIKPKKHLPRHVKTPKQRIQPKNMRGSSPKIPAPPKAHRKANKRKAEKPPKTEYKDVYESVPNKPAYESVPNKPAYETVYETIYVDENGKIIDPEVAKKMKLKMIKNNKKGKDGKLDVEDIEYEYIPEESYAPKYKKGVIYLPEDKKTKLQKNPKKKKASKTVTPDEVDEILNGPETTAKAKINPKKAQKKVKKKGKPKNKKSSKKKLKQVKEAVEYTPEEMELFQELGIE